MANLYDQIPKDGYPKAPTADGSQNNPLNTEVGRNLSNLASAIPGAAGVPGAVAMGTGLAARALGASAPTVGVVGRAAQAAAPYAPVAAGAVALNSAAPTTTPATTLASAVPGAPPQAAPTPAQQPSGNSPVGMSVADAQKQGLVGERVGYDPAYDQRLTGAPGQNGAVTRNGNSYAGTNVSGDITVNGQAPRNGGDVSAQNMAAADGLAQRSQQESMSRVSAQQPVGFAPSGMTAPTVRHSGNDWQARNDLRNAMVSATSIMNDGGKWDKHGQGVVSPERAYAAQLAGTDAQLRGAQPGVDVAAMRESAGIQREGMQQAGATTRTGLQEQGSNTRSLGQLALEQQKVNQAGVAQGFQTRAAQQQEQLRNVLVDPKATPEQRAVAQRDLAALNRKPAADRMQTVTLPDTTNEMGQVVRGGQALVRTREDGTVEQVPIGAQQGAAMPPGMTKQVGTSNGRPVYEDAKGNRYVG